MHSYFFKKRYFFLRGWPNSCWWRQNAFNPCVLIISCSSVNHPKPSSCRRVIWPGLHRDGSSLLHVASLGWLKWGLEDPLPRRVTHMTVQLVLAVGEEPSQGCELGGGSSPWDLLGFFFSMVTGTQERKEEVPGILWPSLRSQSPVMREESQVTW